MEICSYIIIIYVMRVSKPSVSFGNPENGIALALDCIIFCYVNPLPRSNLNLASRPHHILFLRPSQPDLADHQVICVDE